MFNICNSYMNINYRNASIVDSIGFAAPAGDYEYVT